MSGAMRGLLAAALLLASGCAPRFYERSTLVLDHPELDRFTVRYGELEGCLLKRQVPVEYRIRRPRYSLTLRPLSAIDGAAPRLELRFEPAGALELRFPELQPPPPMLYAEPGSRYVVEGAALAGERLRVQIVDGSELVGEERFELAREHCRVFTPG